MVLHRLAEGEPKGNVGTRPGWWHAATRRAARVARYAGQRCVERRERAAILPANFSRAATMLNRQVEHAVELLCQQGCRAVWGVIGALERGESLPETSDLDAAELEAVVCELKAIMSVYADNCPAAD